MRFDKTMMYKVLTSIPKTYRRMNLYSFMLALPIIVVLWASSIALALIADTFFAIKEAMPNG